MLTAIIVAAGSSRRVGFDKLFETIAGRPVIAHTIDAFELADSVDRHHLYAMQTPQIFKRGLIEEAYRAIAEGVLATDEVSAVERLGHKVFLVPNDYLNFKITYPRDLPLAEFVLNQRARPGKGD